MEDYIYGSPATFDDKCLVDISSFLETRLEATRAYKGCVMFAHVEAVNGLARYRACGGRSSLRTWNDFGSYRRRKINSRSELYGVVSINS